MARYGRDFGGWAGGSRGRGYGGDFRESDFRNSGDRGNSGDYGPRRSGSAGPWARGRHPGSDYGGYGADTGFARGMEARDGYSGAWSRGGRGPGRDTGGRYGADFSRGRGGRAMRGRQPGDHYGSDYGGYGGNW